MRMTTVVLALLTGMLAGPALADETQTAAQKILGELKGSMLALRYTIRDDEQREEQVEGMAVCVDAAKAVFLTASISNRIPLANMGNFRLASPEAEQTELKAELLGIDNELGIAFLRCIEQGSFRALTFSPAGELAPAQPLLGVGLLARQAGYQPFVDPTRVSARLRLPEEAVMVSEPFLANTSALIFDFSGKAIGVVQPGRMQGGTFFTPTEEFAFLLGDVPAGGKSRRPAWLGAVEFDGLTRAEELMLSLQNRTAIRVRGIVPGQAAEKAGMKEGDLIVTMNGQPVERFASPEVTARAMLRQISRMKPGQQVQLGVLREGREAPLTVTLGTSPTPLTETARAYVRPMGLAMREMVLIERYVRKMTDAQQGVIVDYVRQDSPVAKTLQAGDVILRVNQQATPDVATAAKVMEAEAVNAQVKQLALDIIRGPEARTVTIDKAQPQ